MTVAELRHQIDRWLDRLSPEHLALVASFIEFLSQKQLQESIVSQNNLTEVVLADTRAYTIAQIPAKQNKRAAFGVAKGSGKILGDIIEPVLPLSTWEALQ
jgi:hypothetical protein